MIIQNLGFWGVSDKVVFEPISITHSISVNVIETFDAFIVDLQGNELYSETGLLNPVDFPSSGNIDLPKEGFDIRFFIKLVSGQISGLTGTYNPNTTNLGYNWLQGYDSSGYPTITNPTGRPPTIIQVANNNQLYIVIAFHDNGDQGTGTLSMDSFDVRY